MVDASVEQEQGSFNTLSDIDNSAVQLTKSSSQQQAFHNDQVTPSKAVASVGSSYSLEVIQLFARLQCEIDEQLIVIESRKKELIQSYLKAKNARLEQELRKEDESVQPPLLFLDVDNVDETSMQQTTKKKRRRLSRRMAVLLPENDIAPSYPLIIDGSGTYSREPSDIVDIDDAEILSLWKSSRVEWIICVEKHLVYK